MLIKKEDSVKKQNSSSCAVQEYPFGNKNIDVARVGINGRYPDKGMVINDACDLIYYILSGTGVITTDKGTYEVKEGDSVLLEKGTAYRVEGKDLFVCLTSAPAWYFEQYREVE